LSESNLVWDKDKKQEFKSGVKKNVEKEIKKEWTWILFIFASISSLYLLGKKMNELQELNRA
jgi:hypothetical protein